MNHLLVFERQTLPVYSLFSVLVCIIVDVLYIFNKLLFTQKQQRDLSRLSRFMDPVQLALTYPQQTVEERRKELHADYQQLEIEYRNVIEKLASTRC